MNVNRLKQLGVFVLFFLYGTTLSNVSSCMSARAAAPADAPAQPQPGAPVFRDLGNYQRKVSTASADAQRYFDQGLTLIYAFNHAEAIRSFREAARLDPNCAMAWWGVALAYGPNINKPMDPGDAPKAWEAVTNARERMSGASDVEKAFIDAVSKRYAEQAPADRVPLDRAYADAMRELVKQFPDDLDAATLFAESLMDLSPWDYWAKDAQPKPETREVLAALESVIKRNDNHPGANHYYIHAVEAVTPEKALASADRLLHFAPGAGHLVHMPAHIYLRMGLYREATVANELASRADQSYITQCNAQGFYPATYYPHNVHFLWYTNAMEGRSAASMAAAKEIAKHAGHMKLSEAERLAPLLSMVQVRFGKWDDVLAQPVPPEDRKFESAMSHYARGLALTATGKPEEAEKELTPLKAIAATPDFKAKDDPNLPAAVLVNIAVHDLTAQIAAKKGDHATAVAQLTEAVQVEDTLPYMEPPYAYMPMRHALGAALIAAGKPADAEPVYREDLKRSPNNGWSLFGLAQSLRAQGKADAADAVQRQFEQAWIRADLKITSSRL
jgi:tetratricopeptide (TPR) repeat protein